MISKIKRRAAVVAVLLASAVAIAGTTAAADPTSNGKTTNSQSTLHRDYLNASVDTTGSDQCAKPVSQRTGAWICPGSAPAATVSPNEGWCDIDGCYTLYNKYDIDFNSKTGYWGYGSWTAGTCQYFLEWKLDGRYAITAKPVRLTTSIPVTNVHFTGDLFNPPPGSDGTEIPGKFYPASAGNSSGVIQWPFPDQGYTAWDQQNYNRTSVVEVTWSLPDYPGYWFLYAKSPISSNGNGNNTPPFNNFYFRGVNQLPAHPFVGGYRN